LTTSDTKEARKFYGKLLDWHFQDMDIGEGTYAVINVGGQGVGGITAVPPNAQGMPPAWGRLRHGRRRRCGGQPRGGTGRARSACPNRNPDRRPLRDDHGSAGATLSLITYVRKN
jgi:hypothetical protein